MSATDGSPTKTGWKRRSSAASFSMCLRYSSSVVAPIARSSPRASIGFIMFARVDGALGRARADDRVQLVDEEDQVALGVPHLGEYGLEPLLELAAVLRAGEHRADVERPDALALQALGDVAGDDPLREALDDRGLADAGVADQDRVVLRAARQHLDHAADLLVAADDRVELAGLRELGQVAAELLERLVGAFRVLAGDALAAADRLDLRLELVARDDIEREQQVLGRDVLVLHPARLVEGLVEHLADRARDVRLLRGALDRRLGAQRRLGLRAQARRRPGTSCWGSSWSSSASSRCSG